MMWIIWQCNIISKILISERETQYYIRVIFLFMSVTIINTLNDYSEKRNEIFRLLIIWNQINVTLNFVPNIAEIVPDLLWITFWEAGTCCELTLGTDDTDRQPNIPSKYKHNICILIFIYIAIIFNEIYVISNIYLFACWSNLTIIHYF